MGYKIILSRRAIKDIESVVRYISLDDTEIARKFAHRLIEKTKELKVFPEKGRIVPEFNDPNIRQLVLKPYRIVYRIEKAEKRISISRFWHSAKDNLEL